MIAALRRAWAWVVRIVAPSEASEAVKGMQRALERLKEELHG